MSCFETENAQFTSEVERIKTSDRVHADVYNERIGKLINNDVALNKKIDERIEEVKNLIGDNISGILEDVAKESSPKNIENGVNSIEAKLADISNVINDALENIAKESSPKNIENTLIQLENKIEKIEESIKTIEDFNTDYLELPNLTSEQIDLRPLITNESYKTMINITGKGYLVAALILYRAEASKKNIRGIKITLDGQVIYWQELNAVIGADDGGSANVMGITNMQNSTSIFNERFSVHPKTNFRYSPQTFIQTSSVHRISKLSSSKVSISSYISKFNDIDTSKVLNSKGLRFEKSLKIECICDSESYSPYFRYLYSLDD